MKNNPWIKDFPQLNSHFHYFDSAATSLKPQSVIDQVTYYNEKLSSNVNRGMYDESQKSTDLYEEARQSVANFIKTQVNNIVFTRGTTSSLNLVAMSYGLSNLSEGDEIITSEQEHHSSILPWLNVASKTGAKIKYIELNSEGKICLDAFKKVITNKTKVVAINHVSNVMGYINPIKEITEIAHNHGAIVVVDGAQAVQHLDLNVEELNIDFYAFSGHKMLGPTGIGILYGKKEYLEKMEPLEFGGDMALDVFKNRFSWKEAPTKFEAGTMPIASVIGLKAAIDYFNQAGMENIHAYSEKLYQYFINKAKKIDGIQIYNMNSDTFIFTFNLKNVPSHDAVSFFSEKKIALRAGQHCAKLIHDFLGINSSLRGTIYFYNTYEDVDLLLDTIQEAIDYFKELGF